MPVEWSPGPGCFSAQKFFRNVSKGNSVPCYECDPGNCRVCFWKKNKLKLEDLFRSVQINGLIQWEGVRTSNFTTTTGNFFQNVKNRF